jgi:diguanylate cyclase (GGDEF)-like protein
MHDELSAAVGPAVRVLLTEDVAADAELELRELKRAGLRFTSLVVETEAAFVEALREFAPEVILSDFSMPGFDGMAALALSRELAPEVPFVFVSGTIGEEYAIRALHSGATDYVLKTNLVRLPAAVERALTQARERRELHRLSRVRDIVSSINSALVRLRERATLFDELCRIAVSRGGFVLARIVEIDRDGKARIAATTELDSALFQTLLDEYNRSPERADFLFAHAMRSARPMISNDVAGDARVRDRAALARDGNYAVALLPIVVDGRVEAIVVLRAREPGFFDQEEVRLLTEMVSNISFALELIEKHDRIAYLALYDTLTGLPNRTLFHERLTQAIESARRAGAAIALALIDLERFKAINDTFGQHTGDRALQAAAARLKETAQGAISGVARLGGNLFALVFQDIAGAEDVARKLEQAVARFFGRPFDLDGREVRLAAKTGIAVFPEDGADADALFRNAEAALQRAKETGERYLFYAPHINARVAEQVELEHRLRRAVERGELVLHYQPKVDMMTGRIMGLEALMRWSGPDGRPVSPTRFVPVLEQTGLILEAGRQALATASAAFRGWQARGFRVPRIAVNVSALQLRRRSFVSDVRAALADLGADGGGIDLEITESLLMTEVDESIRKLSELRDLGLHIAIDDFGTGYSSLAYLSKLPADSLKIDRSFIQDMTENADDTNIISAIISLGQSLRLKIVAEGVETERQAQLLRLLRCDQAQGFLFGPPVPAEDVEALLQTGSGLRDRL